jgi:hypothetical protein
MLLAILGLRAGMNLAVRDLQSPALLGCQLTKAKRLNL